jgi:uncharacterized RDD family membrane protein YckC
LAEEKAMRFPWEPEGERVVFETPEQTLIEYRIAPFGTRLAAALLDRLLITAGVIGCWLLFLLVSLSMQAGSLGPDGLLYLAVLCICAHFVLTIAYFVWAEVRGEGQTWGKRRMEIRTVMASGQGITFFASLVRNLARLVDDLPPMWLLPILSRGKRRLGDWLAGTLVVMAERPALLGPRRAPALAASYRELAERRFYFSSEVAAKLFPEDLNLIEHLGGRLARVSARRREGVLQDVARRYVERLGLRDDAERIAAEPRRFLEELELFLRERFDGEAR